MEKDGNHGSSLVIFYYKGFEKFALWRYISPSKTVVLVDSEPVATGYVNKNFHNP